MFGLFAVPLGVSLRPILSNVLSKDPDPFVHVAGEVKPETLSISELAVEIIKGLFRHPHSPG